MTLKFIINYFLDSHKKLKKISSENKAGNMFYLWYDFLKCSVIHGSIINHYTRGQFFKLSGCERRKSMTYRRILSIYKKCNDRSVQYILEDKSHFNRHFRCVVHRDWCLSHDDTYERFCNLCNHAKALIVKPFDGVNGEGIKKYLVPNEETERTRLWHKLRDGKYIIEECITQHPQMQICGKTINTIRAFSLMDSHGDIHILKTLLRVGVGDSVVDNYSAGGCVYEVDSKTGIVISPSLTKKGEEVYIHPGTETCMLGYKLPNWDKVLEAIVIAQKLIPGNKFTGWDIAITNDGVEFIEGNHNPGYELLEFFGTKGWWSKVNQILNYSNNNV